MNRIKLLDCTLRDGGYINDWNFGEKAILDIVDKLEQSNVDVIEVGFLKEEAYNKERTVYNDVNQISEQINPKKEGITYAAMVEVVNPLPLDKLMPRSEETVELIRVIVWKRLMREGFEYCKGIKEKGYKISVQPARVDQYSYDEFVEMIELFNTIDPEIFYIVDSFGTQTTETLMPYMKLADKHLKPELAVGYHGHNNMMQAFDVAKAFCEMDIKRDLYIDSSVYGMGRGAGNLNSEIIAKYLNESMNKEYKIDLFVEIYARYLSSIQKVYPWGYSMAYYLTAIYNCNPNYAGYYDYDLNLTADEIEEVLKELSDEDKIIFDEAKAKKYLLKKKQELWKKRLCVIIPTANRSEDINYYLKVQSEKFSEHGIDLIVYDSSDDNKTEIITKKYTNYENSTTIYKRYNGEFDGISIDQKIITAYKEHVDNYEYIWICRDGLLVNIERVIKDLYEMFEQNPEAIIVYGLHQNNMLLNNKQLDVDCRKIFKYHCRRMVLLGASIVSSKFIKKVIDSQPIDMEKNYTLWLPIALFDYWEKNEPKVMTYINEIFLLNMHATPSSFWNKKGIAIWQWGERWFKMINLLPPIYNKEKEEVLKLGMVDFTPFEPTQLLIMRINGSLTLKKYIENKKYLDSVANTAPWKFILLCFVPRIICETYWCDREGIHSKIIRLFYKIAKKIYHLAKPIKPVVPYNYNLGKFILDKTSENSCISFEPKQLCIIIPTKNRADVIKDHLRTLGKLYIDYNVDVIIFDSSMDNETKDVVEEWEMTSNHKIRYERYSESDGISLDEKVIGAYKLCIEEYKYIWVSRDKSGINLNVCAENLLNDINKGNDIISINNGLDGNSIFKRKEYKECKAFFKEQFNLMTVLGLTVVKAEFIKDLINTVSIDEIKNYTLWQPMAWFEYISNHKFKATAFYSDITIYHEDALKGSFWMKNHMYQWVERFYVMLDNLPDIYEKELFHVLSRWNDIYKLLDVPYLLTLRVNGYLSLSEVEKYKDKIPYVSRTPLDYYYDIAKMSKRKAQYYLSNIGNTKYQSRFCEEDSTYLGEFNFNKNDGGKMDESK